MQVTPLVEDFDMFVQLINFIGGQLKIIFFCYVNDRLRADGPLKMNVNLCFGKIVVFGIKRFHGDLPVWDGHIM